MLCACRCCDPSPKATLRFLNAMVFHPPTLAISSQDKIRTAAAHGKIQRSHASTELMGPASAPTASPKQWAG